MSTERAYGVQDARDLFARWENGHANEADLAGCLHALIDALSTPPADHVREAGLVPRTKSAVVEIEWADNVIGEEMQGIYGPFESEQAAWDWGLSQIRDGEWSVVEIKAPAPVLIAGQEEDGSAS